MLLRLQGGLGNQLFQLLAIRYLQTKYLNTNPIIFTGHLHKFKTQRSLEINCFLKNEIITEEVNSLNEFLFNSKLSKVLGMFNLHSVSSIKQLENWKHQYLNGYFQDLYNYKDPLLVKQQIQLFNTDLKKYSNSITTGEYDCAVHLRLTDFVMSKKQKDFLIHYRLPYLQSAINWFKQNHSIKRFVLFTDEPAEALRLLNNDEVVLANTLVNKPLTLIEEFALFSSFKNMIASSSTFSYWGSLLGVEKRVVFPQKWDIVSKSIDDVFQKNLLHYNTFSYSKNTIVIL